MALEVATYINDLVPTNPPGTDSKSQGDDHLRLIKAALQATFPKAIGARKLMSEDVGAADTFRFTIYRNRHDPAPVAEDLLGSYVISGNDSLNNETNYVRLQGGIVSPINNAESGKFSILMPILGVETAVFTIRPEGVTAIGKFTSAGGYDSPFTIKETTAATGAYLYLERPVDTNADIWSQTATAGARWLIRMGGDGAETGGAAGRGGSLFRIYSFDNSGSAAVATFTIARDTHLVSTTGAMTLGGRLTAPGVTSTADVAAVTTSSVKGAGAGNVHFWMYGNAGEDRVVMYTDSASYGSLAIRVAGGSATPQTYTLGNDGTFSSPGSVIAANHLYASGTNIFHGTIGTLRYHQYQAGWTWEWNAASGNLRWIANNTQSLNIDPSGNVSIQDALTVVGVITASSDERLKTNIHTIENALSKVNALRGVSFTKTKDGEEGIGVIAQELLNVVPEVVREDEDGYYSVAYGNLTGLLIEAVKDLTFRLRAMEMKVLRPEVMKFEEEEEKEEEKGDTE